MLTHSQIWDAIDSLAKLHKLSTSGLAKRAGLDPTTFNKSKRFSADGKARWPSTESVAKILAATDSDLEEFVGLMHGERQNGRAALSLPLVGVVHAGTFDEPAPELNSGVASEVVRFPGAAIDQVYALRILGDSMQPAYRSGDIVVVAPKVEIRRGDRVVLKIRNGEARASEFISKSPEQTVLRSFNIEDGEHAIDNQDISWIARIVWASQ